MKRFRYALQPVLLTRQWALDALRLELSEQNALIAEQESLIAAVGVKAADANRQWQALAGSGASQSVDGFVVATRYLADLARQSRELAARLEELVAGRDDVIARVVLAQRAVEAAEQHRDECKEQFVQQRLSADFKDADDQWNTLQTGVLAHGS